MALISQSTAVAMIVATLTLTPVVARAQPNQEAIKQTLTAAQASLAEMTKLPAAATLQGDVRTAVSDFIAEFNAFASLPKDWKAKYQVASASLDKMLAAAAAAPAPAAAPAAPAPAAPADSNASGKWDPTVVEMLKKVRTQLDGFEKATGDPLFIVKDIEKLLDAAGAASGTVTLDAAKLATLKEQLGRIKAVAGGV
ncbi:MAG TPA: hypothetical protein VL243_17485 [Vicinamibacterales bacterium]|nr:hypothetical protein [Vicinamibacterales bacterium]